MRRCILSLLAGLAVVTATPAQFPVQVAVPNAGPSYSPQVPSMEAAPYVGPLWTFDLQYLLYFVKPVHFNTGVLGTTNNPDLTLGGLTTSVAPGDPNFVPVLGPGSKDRGPFNGVRLSVTRALPVDFARTAYLEMAGFWIFNQGSDRRLTSSPDGNPAILLPFTTNTTTAAGPPGNYSAVIAGFTGVNGVRVAGSASANTGQGIWGSEVNVAGPCCECSHFAVEALFGFRYLGLDDKFDLSATSNAGTGFLATDSFHSRCYFYGAQAGTRFLISNDRWAGLLSAKVGLGDTHSRLTISGNTVVPGDVLPGGFYTSAANIGTTNTDYFGVVVDLNAAVRFAVCQTVGVSVGYNFLSWSGVVRAADQVPTTINPGTTTALNPAGGVAAFGTTQPTRQTDVSTLWMHGINFGIDFRY